MKKTFIALALLGTLAVLAMPAAHATKKAADCCAPGAACCVPGAPCCR